MVHIMKFEKEKIKNSWRIIDHRRAIPFFLFLFTGFILAYLFWHLLLPVDIANNLFSAQMNALMEINSPSGAAIFPTITLKNILTNNFRVLALCVLFSLLFGSGAIFILIWNASVIGVAIATAIRLGVAAGGVGIAAYFGAFSFAILRFLLHGIPEMLAYFIGGLAGGIISFTFLDSKLGARKFALKLTSSLKNVSLLILVAAILVVVSGIIEVLITPLFIQ